MAIKIEKVNYAGWPNCLRLSNRQIELVVTTDVGPRIIRCGFLGGENELKEYPEMLGKTGGSEWKIYGGHRLWHAPEAEPRTYYPDNGSVEHEQLKAGGKFGWQGVRVVQPVESTAKIQKEMEIRLSPDQARVEVLHRLRNRGMWDVKLAPWALSVMAPGGRAIIPLPPRGPHPENLPPTNSVTFWAYTDFSDPRWILGFKYLILRNDPKRKDPQKIGVMCPDGWVAYARGGRLFAKKFKHQLGASYPDFGCSVETFTNHAMLEIETLGPTAKLAPGAQVTHVEEWRLAKKVPEPQNDRDVDKRVLPVVK
jgi:hypothetical protein